MGNLFIRKAENARLAPTTTGRTDKRALFALEGGSEVVEELAFEARQKEKRSAFVQPRPALESPNRKRLFSFRPRDRSDFERLTREARQ